MNTSIPSELEEKMMDTFGKYKKKKRISYSMLSFAAALLLFAATVNVSPAAASALADIPVVGKVVQVITIKEWNEQDGNANIAIKTPGVKDLENQSLANSLNEKYLEENEALYKKFKEETAKDNGHYSVESGYEVKTDDAQLLSLGRYTVETQASAAESIKYDTIDKKNETFITLPSLFKNNAYVDVISTYITSEMKEKMKDESVSYFIKDQENPDGFEKINASQNFYINKEHKLVISFNEYEVAAGYMGVVEFEIPTAVIKDQLVSDAYIK